MSAGHDAKEAPRLSRSRLWVRVQLTVMTVGWFAVSIASALIIRETRVFALIVSALGFGAGVCTATLIMFPSVTFAYRVGGTLGIGTIGFRITSLLVNAGKSVPIDDVIISVSITIMFSTLYWQWWLNVVGRWRKISGWTPRHR